MKTTPIPHLGGDYAKDAEKIEDSFGMLYDALETVASSLDTKIQSLNKKLDEGFERIDRRFERIDKRFEQMDRRFERFEKNMEAMNQAIHLTLRELRGGREETNARIKRLESAQGFLVREEPPAPEA